MFAIFKHGGKQYRADKNSIIELEKMSGSSGDKVEFNDVILFSSGDSVKIEGDELKNCSVKAEILKQKKQDKIIVFKKKRRQNYRRTKGHSQNVTVIKISDIVA